MSKVLERPSLIGVTVSFPVSADFGLTTLPLSRGRG
jgi:hypothetical protein